MMHPLAERTVIVTGGTGTLGMAIAEAAVGAGAHVVVSARDENRGTTFAHTLGERARFVRHEAGDEASWAALVESCLAWSGRLDGLFNNVGGTGGMLDLAAVSPEEFAAIWDLNVCTTLLGMKHGYRAMRGTGGAIVNIGSIAGTYVNPMACGYCASKAAIPAITRGAAAEFASGKVRVNALHPGVISSAMTEENFARKGNKDAYLSMVPLRRLADPAEIARLAIYLISDAANGITGSNIVADGGRTIF